MTIILKIHKTDRDSNDDTNVVRVLSRFDTCFIGELWIMYVATGPPVIFIACSDAFYTEGRGCDTTGRNTLLPSVTHIGASLLYVA